MYIPPSRARVYQEWTVERHRFISKVKPKHPYQEPIMHKELAALILSHVTVFLQTGLFLGLFSREMGGVVASWSVHSSPDRAVLVRALAGDIVLCSWVRHLTLTVPLYSQVYKWVLRTILY